MGVWNVWTNQMGPPILTHPIPHLQSMKRATTHKKNQHQVHLMAELVARIISTQDQILLARISPCGFCCYVLLTTHLLGSGCWCRLQESGPARLVIGPELMVKLEPFINQARPVFQHVAFITTTDLGCDRPPINLLLTQCLGWASWYLIR